MISRRQFLKLSAVTGIGLVAPWKVGIQHAFASVQVLQVPLAGRAIPQWMGPLPHFAGARVPGNNPITVTMEEFQQQVLPAGFPQTWVWGYDVGGAGKLYPGFTVEATRGTPTTMTYVNNLPVSGSIVQQYITFDQSVHWANPDGVPMMVPNPNYPPPPMMIGNPLIYTGSPPAVVHLHGGEVLSDYDGGPEQWFTSDGQHGPAYRSAIPGLTNRAVYVYPNDQDATTLWFHDHTLGATRLNVYAGLAAFYFLRDWTQERSDLPGGPADTWVQEPLPGGGFTPPYKPEIEIVIQDRMFDTNGQWLFPDAPPLNPEHPYWLPEFLGDTIVVNGKTWPYLNVEPRRYRFRFLNGSNARFYRMWLENMVTATPGPVFWQIGSDGGLLNLPVMLNPADPVTPRFLLLAPGERADIIIDFAGFAGQTITLRNNARAPFPKGATVDPQTVGRIMQFRVGTALSNPVGPTGDPSYDPTTGLSPRNSPIVPLNPAAATVRRQLTLNEVMGMPQTVGGVAYLGGPIEVLVNNTKWAGMDPQGNPIPGSTPDGQGNYLTELPKIGSTEVWDIINLTADAHPIHLHLVQFQLVHRQAFNVNKYTKKYDKAFLGGGVDPMTGQPYPAGIFMPAYGPPLPYQTPNAAGALGGNPDITPHLQGPARPPEPNETGWKDTVIMYPGEVTRIVVRWANQSGGPYPFDATAGPGYVWHCHIVDHEDNEMMRPYKPVP